MAAWLHWHATHAGTMAGRLPMPMHRQAPPGRVRSFPQPLLVTRASGDAGENAQPAGLKPEGEAPLRRSSPRLASIELFSRYDQLVASGLSPEAAQLTLINCEWSVSQVTVELRAMESNVISEIQALYSKLTSGIDAMGSNLIAEIKAMDSNVTSAIKAMDSNVTSEIKGMDSNVTSASKAMDSNVTSASKAMDSNVTSASKAMDSNVTSEIKGMDSSVTSEIKAMEGNVTSEIKGLESNVTSEIKGLESNVTPLGLKRLESSMDSNTKKLEHILDRKMQLLVFIIVVALLAHVEVDRLPHTILGAFLSLFIGD